MSFNIVCSVLNYSREGSMSSNVFEILRLKHAVSAQKRIRKRPSPEVAPRAAIKISKGFLIKIPGFLPSFACFGRTLPGSHLIAI